MTKARKKFDHVGINKDATVKFLAFYSDLTKRYCAKVKLRSDTKLTYRLRTTMTDLRSERKRFYLVDGESNSILEVMGRRYVEFLHDRYESGKLRVSEWIADDWKSFLNEEYAHQITHQQSYSKVSKWSSKEILEFLTRELAFRELEDFHSFAMNSALTNKVLVRPLKNPLVEEYPNLGDSSGIAPKVAIPAASQKRNARKSISVDDESDIVLIDGSLKVSRKVRAAMHLHLLFMLGHSLDDIVQRRIAYMMSILERDVSDKSIGRNVQAIHQVIVEYESHTNKGKSQKSAVKEFMSHFTNNKLPKNSFLNYLLKEK